jgi:Xaa-Pro aminopeptidase
MAAHGGGVAIIPTAPEQQRNSDCDFPFRADSYFTYLTGFPEPEAFCVLSVTAAGKATSTLFCRAKDAAMEIWDGYRYGPDAARTAFGFDEAFPVAELDTQMTRLLSNASAVWWPFSVHAGFEAHLQRWLASVRKLARQRITAPAAQHDVCVVLDEQRLFKDTSEIATMRRAAQISSAAHQRAMRASRVGAREFELEAELLYAFRKNGAQSPAYTSIVATGANTCILHYAAADAVLKDGDLVLIDAGCEQDGYASDITRTFPANGKFSDAQRTLYDIVLRSQLAAIKATRAGAKFTDPHDAAVSVLIDGMLDVGLLDKNKVGSASDVLASGAYKQFYMHSTGHWLGMDVHDVGAYAEPGAAMVDGKAPSRTLRAGMVTTIEPGIYVQSAAGVDERFWNIGIRIEDDALVTDGDADILSSDAPKTIADIEALMRDRLG